MKKLLLTAPFPLLLCRLASGMIFVSEGLQKFIRPDGVGAGRFARTGFADPVCRANVTGAFKIICGLLLLIGLMVRFAVVPLLVVMGVAFMTTGWPVLNDKGSWPFMHEYRTDFVLTILLILLLIYGAGGKSLDQKMRARTLRSST